MEFTTQVSLIDGTSLLDEGPEQLAVAPPPRAWRHRLTLRQLTPAVRSALQTIHREGGDPTALNARVLQAEGFTGMARLNQCVTRLGQLALLCHHLRADGEPLLTVRPISPSYRHDEHKVTPDAAYVLSQFAYCRNDQGRWVLESPRGHAVVYLHAPLAQQLLHELYKPRTARELADLGLGVSTEGARMFLTLLANAGAVVASADGQLTPEANDPTLAPWEFHDLLFHTRSRIGRHDNPYGGTFPFKDKFEFLPVIKPESSAERVDLFVPDLERLKQDDRPFTQVLEARASVRESGEAPLNLKQLGEFLYRSARVKKIAAGAGVSWRPSPGGGALHELEIYPIVQGCQGLERGLYHYNPQEHSLYKVTGYTEDVETLLGLARITSESLQPPQVLLVIAARFQRLQLKYRSVSYAVTLKNVGAIYQTFYLVATAMGLAPCALGGGHSDLFARAARLDYYAETSVGEFLLSSRPPVNGK